MCRMHCYLSRNHGQSLRCSSWESSLEAVTVIEHSNACLTCADPFQVVDVQCQDSVMNHECLLPADTLGAYSSGELAEKLAAAGIDAHF